MWVGLVLWTTVLKYQSLIVLQIITFQAELIPYGYSYKIDVDVLEKLFHLKRMRNKISGQ
jgi:hypothetical protein